MKQTKGYVNLWGGWILSITHLFELLNIVLMFV